MRMAWLGMLLWLCASLMGPHAYRFVKLTRPTAWVLPASCGRFPPQASPLPNLPSLLPASHQASKAAGEGGKKEAGSKKAAGGGKRKKPTQGEGTGEDGGAEDGGAEAAPAPAGPKWGSVKVRDPQPGGCRAGSTAPCLSSCGNLGFAAGTAGGGGSQAAVKARAASHPARLHALCRERPMYPLHAPCEHDTAPPGQTIALPPCAGAKRVRREMRTFYNDAGEEVTGETPGAAWCAQQCNPCSSLD